MGRFSVVPDLDGPKIRLGLIWFFLGLAALAINIFVAAVVFAVVAGFGAQQASEAWRRAGEPVQQPVAIVAAAGFPIAAAFSHVSAGFWVLTFPIVALLWALVRSSADELPMREVAYTLQSSLFTGLAAAAPILAYHEDVVAAYVLFVLIAAYDCGDFLVGAGSRSPIEGLIAGVLAVAVLTFTLRVVGPEPFSGNAAWVFGAAIAIFAPVGQMATSALLPHPGAKVPALRRLDTAIVAGPIFLVMLRVYLG